MISTRQRASSDPLSRGGAFSASAPNSRLENEPNPFEQSFSGPVVSSEGTDTRRARSNSPPTSRTPGTGPRLPPLSYISSPSTELAQFGWTSLRTGPLSPALLNGPAHPHSAALTGLPNMYDQHLAQPMGVTFAPQSPNTAAMFAMMTNGTPNGQTDPTALADLHQTATATSERPAGSDTTITSHGNVIVPTTNEQDPSLVTSSSAQLGYPVTSHANPLGATILHSIRPHPVAYPGIHPMHQLPHLHPHPQPIQAQYPHSHQQQQHGNPLYLLSQAQDLSQGHPDDATAAAAAALSNLGVGGLPMPLAVNGMTGLPTSITVNSSGTAFAPLVDANLLTRNVKSPSNPTNGLPPVPMPQISQQPLSKLDHNRASENIPPVQNHPPTRAKRKASEEPSQPARRTKKSTLDKEVKEENDEIEDPDEYSAPKKSSTRGRAARGRGKGRSTTSRRIDDDDDDASEEDDRPRTAKEFENEKRKNFLERNRQAASKCRARKKEWLANLQSKVASLTGDNEQLQSLVDSLRKEVVHLRSALETYAPAAVQQAQPAYVTRY